MIYIHFSEFVQFLVCFMVFVSGKANQVKGPETVLSHVRL